MHDPIPLSMAISLVKEIWTSVRNVKVYRRRCRTLAWRCNLLINALTENTAGIVPPTQNAVGEAVLILEKVRNRVTQWADLNVIKSILGQGEISEGVNLLHQEIDTCIAVYHVRINQELVHGQRVQALAAERDRAELRETLRELQEELFQYTRGNRNRAPYNLPRDRAEQVLHNIGEDINDLQPSVFDDDALRRSSTNWLSVELRLLGDDNTSIALGDLMSGGSSYSRHSMERSGPSRSIRWLKYHIPFRRTSSSSVPMGRQDDQGPRDEDIGFFRRPTISVELPSPMHSPVLSRPSSLRSGSRNVAALLHIPHHTSQVSTGSTSNTSGSSSLEVGLSTRQIVCGSSSDPPVAVRATMEDLVNYLLLNPEDKEHQDIFFIGHPVCISPQGVLRILIRKFNDASTRTDEMCCMKVMHLIRHWLTNQNVIVGNDVLAEMQTFADAVNSPHSLRELALEVLQLIPDKALLNFPLSRSSPDLWPNTKPTDSQLAGALTALEWRKYQCILAAEYIAHACKIPAHSPNLQEALALNQRIANWVTSSILKINDYKKRSNVKRFFANTAKECQRIRNFSSTCTIMGALEDPSITCLSLTHETMPRKEQQQYQTLATLIRQEFDYKAYRAAAQYDEKKGCIPWHDVHLHDIDVVLKDDGVDDHHELPLINFKKWTHLKEKALDALRYRDNPPKYNENGLESATAYLERELQAVTTISDDFIEWVQTKSAELKRNEGTMERDRAIHLVFGN